MENWRHYQKREEILDDSVYITEVLGIKIPLNESHPYSLGLMEEIYKEQILLEGFLDSAVNGQPINFMVVGERTTGKSSFLNITREYAKEKGYLVNDIPLLISTSHGENYLKF